MRIAYDKAFHMVPTFLTLTLKFDLLLKNFNLGHNFLTRNDRAFILHMCIAYNKTFHMVYNFWLCDLDLEVWPTYEKL